MSRGATYKFQLYTAKDTQNSALALANLTALCNAHLPGRHTIEVIDVIKEPQRALAGGIRMTPTLVKVSPQPTRMIVGTLKQTDRVLVALGIANIAA
jgi:circadian clock protein KaiB